jgi:hypothetical protein
MLFDQSLFPVVGLLSKTFRALWQNLHDKPGWGMVFKMLQ